MSGVSLLAFGFLSLQVIFSSQWCWPSLSGIAVYFQSSKMPFICQLLIIATQQAAAPLPFWTLPLPPTHPCRPPPATSSILSHSSVNSSCTDRTSATASINRAQLLRVLLFDLLPGWKGPLWIDPQLLLSVLMQRRKKRNTCACCDCHAKTLQENIIKNSDNYSVS